MSNNRLPHPIFLIPRFGKRRTLSKQTQKDQELIANRIQRNAIDKEKVLSKLEIICGPNPQKKDMLILAQHLVKKFSLQLDRLAKRSRDCLICWFCEKWVTISSELNELCETQPRIYDSRNSCGSQVQNGKDLSSFSDNLFYFDSFSFFESTTDSIVNDDFSQLDSISELYEPIDF